jgi:hypothetical protein
LLQDGSRVYVSYEADGHAMKAVAAAAGAAHKINTPPNMLQRPLVAVGGIDSG